ncbi:hypothetical protein Q3G72_019172 [Acer saccharum]|nr:hypothetical protein Q3G72_019172 [Acer saccharum]
MQEEEETRHCFIVRAALEELMRTSNEKMPRVRIASMVQEITLENYCTAGQRNQQKAEETAELRHKHNPAKRQRNSNKNATKTQSQKAQPARQTEGKKQTGNKKKEKENSHNHKTETADEPSREPLSKNIPHYILPFHNHAPLSKTGLV